ncbi:MAG: Holliday junction branch migration DNA helicase RuvB [Patescibacteria group bacterium]
MEQWGELEPREVSPELQNTEVSIDTALRPKSLEEFIGQPTIKENLRIFLEAAKKRGEPCDHVLLYGPPGLGKTTLAHVIANEMGANIRVTSGPALERVGDLAAILTNLEHGDVLFIDEIHRMNRSIEEVLYPAMEDYALDIVMGKGPTARTLRLDLKRFTIIGATTRLSMLSAPLRDRFGSHVHLDFYGEDEMHDILARSSGLLNLPSDEAALRLIAKRSRRTPRIANRLLRRVRDYAQVMADGAMTETIVDGALRALEIDALGLDQADRRVLSSIIETFKGGPVGLSTLAAATSEEMDTLEDVIEPFLLQQGLITRTPRGRVASEFAYRHLGFPTPPTTDTINPSLL